MSPIQSVYAHMYNILIPFTQTFQGKNCDILDFHNTYVYIVNCCGVTNNIKSRHYVLKLVGKLRHTKNFFLKTSIPMVATYVPTNTTLKILNLQTTYVVCTYKSRLNANFLVLQIYVLYMYTCTYTNIE